MGGMPEARRVFGGAEVLDDILDSLSAAVFGDADPSQPDPGVQPTALS
jgi:hypothetical protein